MIVCLDKNRYRLEIHDMEIGLTDLVERLRTSGVYTEDQLARIHALQPGEQTIDPYVVK